MRSREIGDRQIGRGEGVGGRAFGRSGVRRQQLGDRLALQTHRTNPGGDAFATCGEAEYVYSAAKVRIENQIGLPESRASMAEGVNRHGPHQSMQAVADVGDVRILPVIGHYHHRVVERPSDIRRGEIGIGTMTPQRP